MEMTSYDIAIVGSGIACSTTLCELAERLKETPARGRMLRIAVIEREGEMWNGIPYGKRSAVGALAFQRLQEFLEEPERGYYIEWLAANADCWLKTFKEYGGPGAAKWIADNQFLMERDRWGELYLPRFLFGLYVSSQAARAVKELATDGLASVTPIHGEATGIWRMPGGHLKIAVKGASGVCTSLKTARAVLAIGSPPQRSIQSGAATSRHHTHIDDIYSPSEDVSIHKIQQALSSLPDKRMANILILGSNASSLEVLYLINYRPEIRNHINSVVVLSRSGLLPYKICEETVQFELMALDSLRESSYFSAADLMAAITCDIRRAEELGLNIADLRDPVGAAVSTLTALLPISEQKKFVCEHGVHFSRMMRRAGRDTRTAADELVDMRILTTVKGDFRRLEPFPSGNGLISATYATPGCQAEITHPVPFSITINCGGFEELDFCSSRLINSLIDNHICSVNSTNRGFVVNDRLEASENVYVIGPLVGGNFNEKVRFWHVESASRIVGLAKLLAASLSDSLFPPRMFPLSDTIGPSGRMAPSAYLATCVGTELQVTQMYDPSVPNKGFKSQ
jgi:uncharacterized NAD(P)/FAD-binding protein YdhS